MLVMRPGVLRPEYWNAAHQLYFAVDGNGARAGSHGTKVFCINIYTGEHTYIRRTDVMGAVKPDRLPGWAKEKAAALLEEFGLLPWKKNSPYELSQGQQRRLALLSMLAGEQSLLLLDEPINGLDPEGIVEFRNILLELNRQRETTILISSHILSELQNLATCYGFIDQGRMLEQTSAAALSEKCRDCLELKVDDAPRCAALLERELGWEAKLSLEDMCADAWRWQKNNPRGYRD